MAAIFPLAGQAQFLQQGNKLVGSSVGAAKQGYSVALSANGTTLAVGGPTDNSDQGAVWIYTRSNGVWNSNGAKLVASGTSSTYPQQGWSVALSADGNTLIEGSPTDGADGQTGAAWVFTRSNGVWTQQAKLIGTGAINSAEQGAGVAISADGNTAIVGGPADNGGYGGAWVFTRANGVWTQPGGELIGTGVSFNGLGQYVAYQGWAVALSGDGNTALLGGWADNSNYGATWVFVRSGNTWTQQGAKLVGITSVPYKSSGIQQGYSVALSTDGNTALVGGDGDDLQVGAAWVFTRAGTAWTQQAKLIGTNAQGSALQGWSVSLSGDGNTALFGGYYDNFMGVGQEATGAAWIFRRSNGSWGIGGTKLAAGTGGVPGPNSNGTMVGPYEGSSVALSADGSTAAVGGVGDSGNNGATWVYAQPHFTFTTPSTANGGVSFNFSVSAQDANNNALSSYAGTAHFTSTDSVATLPANSILSGGTGNFSATLKSAGSQTLTATDTANSGITGTSSPITVSGQVATHFSITAPGSATSGTAFQFTVTALDASNNTVGGYSGTVHFSSSDTAAVLPANSTLSSGVGTFSATLKTGGSQTISAVDTVNSSLTGISSGITVGGQVATHFSVTAPGSATSGTAFQFTVTALDASNNTVTGYSGTVHFSSSDVLAVLPANSTLTNGAGTFSATLKTGGSQTISAVDTVISSVTGISSGITVGVGPVTHFSIAAPASATSGTPFNFTVTAQDGGNNTVAGYSGTVHFGSSDTAAVLPANSTLASGVGNFSATLKTTGSQTISATDTVSSGVTGISSGITVGAAAAIHFSIAAPSSATSGTAFSFTVTAKDAGNNTVTGYSGTVHFSSTDTAAALPANSTLTSGAGSFSATLKTAGSQTISAVDTVNSSEMGVSSAITVNSGPATHFFVSAPPAATAGAAFSFTVTAQDANNNTAAGYSGTVHFSSTDGAAVLPANSTLTNGAGTFSATLKTAGSQSVSAGDTVTTSITGTSGTIVVTTVSATPPNPLSVSPAGGTAAASQTMTFVYTDPRGYQDLGVVNVLVNNFIDGRQACYLAYVVAQSTLYLVDDGGDAGGPFAGGVALGSSTPIHNSQCSVVLVSAQGSGNNLTLVMTVTWTTSFAGDKVTYTAARDGAGNNSGWYPLGVVRVPGTQTTTTAVVGVGPFRGTGLGPTQFTFNFSDSKGFADLGVENILVNNALNGVQACYLAYSRPANVMYLVNDTGTALLPGQSMAASGSLSNSQCSVAWGPTPVMASANTLTLTLTIGFTSTFGGNRIIYVAARDVNEGNNTGWDSMGTWTPQ